MRLSIQTLMLQTVVVGTGALAFISTMCYIGAIRALVKTMKIASQFSCTKKPTVKKVVLLSTSLIAETSVDTFY